MTAEKIFKTMCGEMVEDVFIALERNGVTPRLKEFTFEVVNTDTDERTVLDFDNLREMPDWAFEWVMEACFVTAVTEPCGPTNPLLDPKHDLALIVVCEV